MSRLLDSAFITMLPPVINPFQFTISIEGIEGTGKTTLKNFFIDKVNILNDVVEIKITDSRSYFQHIDLRCILFDMSKYKSLKENHYYFPPPSSKENIILVGTKVDLIPAELWRLSYSHVSFINFNILLIFTLPDLIVKKIFSYFNLSQIMILGLISKEWRGLYTNNMIWEQLYHRDFKGKIPFDLINPPHYNGKSLLQPNAWMLAYKNIYQPTFIYPNFIKRFAERKKLPAVIISALKGFGINELIHNVADTLHEQRLNKLYNQTSMGVAFMVMQIIIRESSSHLISGAYFVMLTRDPDRIVITKQLRPYAIEYFIASSDVIDVQVHENQVKVLDCTPKHHVFYTIKEYDAHILGQQIGKFQLNNMRD